VSNPHASSAGVTIVFYDEDGNQDASYDVSGGLPAHGSEVIDVSAVGIGDSSWRGSAVVQSEGQLAAAVALKVNSSTDRELYSGFTQAGTSAYMPAVVRNPYPGRDYDQLSTLVVQNTSGSPATVTATYLSTTGGANPTFSFTVPAYASKYLDSSSDNGVGGPSLGSGWLGSASFTSGAGEIVLVNHQPYVNSPKAVAYEGVSQGYNKIFFPTAQQKIYTAKFTTFYAIQNVGTTDANVRMTVYNTSGGTVGTVSTTLSPNAKVSWEPRHAGAPESFLGSAVVESTNSVPIAGIVNIGTLPMSGCPTGAGQTMAFTAPGEGAANVAIPWAEYKSGTEWRTFVAVQNIGTTTSGNVTVTYYNANGSVAAPHALGTIAPGAKANSNPNTAGAGSFVGSFEVTSDNASDQLIVLTSNQQADQCHAASLMGIPFTP
jgi:hypothetical protein